MLPRLPPHPRPNLAVRTDVAHFEVRKLYGIPLQDDLVVAARQESFRLHAVVGGLPPDKAAVVPRGDIGDCLRVGVVRPPAVQHLADPERFTHPSHARE